MAKSILYMSKPEDVKSNLLQMGLARASLASIRVLRTFIDSIAKNLHKLQICLRFYFFPKNSTFRLLIKIISSVRTIVTVLYHLYDTLLTKFRHTVIKAPALCYSFAARLLTF